AAGRRRDACLRGIAGGGSPRRADGERRARAARPARGGKLDARALPRRAAAAAGARTPAVPTDRDRLRAAHPDAPEGLRLQRGNLRLGVSLRAQGLARAARLGGLRGAAARSLAARLGRSARPAQDVRRVRGSGAGLRRHPLRARGRARPLLGGAGARFQEPRWGPSMGKVFFWLAVLGALFLVARAISLLQRREAARRREAEADA